MSVADDLDRSLLKALLALPVDGEATRPPAMWLPDPEAELVEFVVDELLRRVGRYGDATAIGPFDRAALQRGSPTTVIQDIQGVWMLRALLASDQRGGVELILDSDERGTTVPSAFMPAMVQATALAVANADCMGQRMIVVDHRDNGSQVLGLEALFDRLEMQWVRTWTQSFIGTGSALLAVGGDSLCVAHVPIHPRADGARQLYLQVGSRKPVEVCFDDLQGVQVTWDSHGDS